MASPCIWHGWREIVLPEQLHVLHTVSLFLHPPTSILNSVGKENVFVCSVSLDFCPTFPWPEAMPKVMYTKNKTKNSIGNTKKKNLVKTHTHTPNLASPDIRYFGGCNSNGNVWQGEEKRKKDIVQAMCRCHERCTHYVAALTATCPPPPRQFRLTVPEVRVGIHHHCYRWDKDETIVMHPFLPSSQFPPITLLESEQELLFSAMECKISEIYCFSGTMFLDFFLDC